MSSERLERSESEENEDGDTEPDDPEVRESVDSFRRAGSAVGDGLGTLYEGSRMWLGRRHWVVRFVTASAIWFGGNWTYNRIAPTVIEGVLASLRRLSGFEIAPLFGAFENRPLLVSAQVLMVLLAVVVAQNRIQTRKLKDIKHKLATMTNDPTEVTDGGPRELPPTGGRAIGGAIAGGAIGLTFGPGGLLAGMFLGFAIGDRRDIRAYRRNPHTPNADSRTE